VAWKGLIADALALRTSSIFDAFKTLCLLTPGGTEIWSDLIMIKDEALGILQSLGRFPKTLRLGKLSTKIEAAGKVRIFGITDG